MKHKYTVLFGTAFGVVMALVWGVVFCSILGAGGIGVGACFGIAFACFGCLLGRSIDKKSDKIHMDYKGKNKLIFEL